MRARILVAVVCIPLLLVVIFLLPPIALSILVALLSAVAVYEVLVSTQYIKQMRLVLYGMVFGAAIPFWAYFGSALAPAVGGLLLFCILLFGEAIYSKGNIKLEQIAIMLFAAILLPFFLSSLVRILRMSNGAFVILLPFAIAFGSDAAALFVGMAIGERKLAPSLSPKKTMEGAAGGLLAGIVLAILYGLVVGLICHRPENYLALIVYGMFGSAISQIGDLSFSLIKREFSIKDYGKLLPGHGGVLDRFDSVLFCAPLIEFLLLVWPAVL